MADAMNGVSISTTKNHVSDYINYHLEKHGFQWSTCPNLHPPNTFNLSMRRLGDEFELRYRDTFNEMFTELHITPTSAYPTFAGVTSELFHKEIQWGHIVALFAFGGSIATQSMNKEMPALVDLIVDWVSTYIDEHIIEWINENGSWEGIVQYYDVDALKSRTTDSSWPKFRNFVCGAAALLTLTAIVSSRSWQLEELINNYFYY